MYKIIIVTGSEAKRTAQSLPEWQYATTCDLLGDKPRPIHASELLSLVSALRTQGGASIILTGEKVSEVLRLDLLKAWLPWADISHIHTGDALQHFRRYQLIKRFLAPRVIRLEECISEELIKQSVCQR